MYVGNNIVIIEESSPTYFHWRAVKDRLNSCLPQRNRPTTMVPRSRTTLKYRRAAGKVGYYHAVTTIPLAYRSP